MMKQSKPPLRIYHGPVNVGGVGRILADWQRSQGAISDFTTFTEHVHARYPAHLCLNIHAYGIVGKILITLAHFWLCFVKYDLFHFDFGNSLLPLNLDLPLLKLFRKKILMTYYGSDIRLMVVEKQRNPYYERLAFDSNHPKRDKWKKLKLYWHKLWIDRFFAIRELYEWAVTVLPPERVIEDVWVVTQIDASAYMPTYETKPIPTLVHAPTNPRVKGSEYVEQAIQTLRDEGYQFEYRRLEKVPNAEAQRIYREDADIIVDEFFCGSFGILAVEGMYYGKPVCSFIMDDVLKRIPDCPIVNCTIDNVKEKLAWLIEHPEERVRIGKAGRAFVEKHCDGEKINQQVWQVYHDLMK